MTTLPRRAGPARVAVQVLAALGPHRVGRRGARVGVSAAAGRGLASAAAVLRGQVDTGGVPYAFTAVGHHRADAILDPLGAARAARCVGGRAEVPLRVLAEPAGGAGRAGRTAPAVAAAAVFAAHARLAGGHADGRARAVVAGLPFAADAAEGAAAVLPALPSRAEGRVVAVLALARVVAEAVGPAGPAGEPALRVRPALQIRAVGDATPRADTEGLGLEVAAAEGDVRAGRREPRERHEHRCKDFECRPLVLHIRTSTGSLLRRSRRPPGPRSRPG